MRFAASFKVLGILLMIFSLSMLPPIGVAIYYSDGAIGSFVTGFFITLVTGFLVWWPFRSREHELKTRDGFLVVVLFWTVLSLFGAIPLFIDFFPKLSFTDAMFESVSGLTTTGATILTHLREMPHAILYYRQQLHFFGGMGIIVLAVAILPMLGVGGMQLYRAETVGPIKTKKLRPRMAQTAKALWSIYVGLVVICGLCYWAAGMHLFDAIGESFSTISTGGFATHDSSFRFYHSPLIDGIGVVFMLLGAINFGLHYQFLKTKRLSIYALDSEVRAYIAVLVSAIIIVLISLLFYHEFHHGRTLLNVIFTVVSLGTTTGFTTTNFSVWPSFIPYLLMFLVLLGGCGGSTAGGIKIMRCLLLKEQAKRELKRLVHPNAVMTVKLGDQVLSESVIDAIWGFVTVFVVLFVVLLLVLLASGLEVKTAFGALASCLANTGASIGSVANNYEHIPEVSKWTLILAMLAGRLEIFTILVLFTPGYWRK